MRGPPIGPSRGRPPLAYPLTLTHDLHRHDAREARGGEAPFAESAATVYDRARLADIGPCRAAGAVSCGASVEEGGSILFAEPAVALTIPRPTAMEA
jgi:hypothetical protein